ncbi:hypothetical protein CJ030_MR2G016181 [Morella rubra]|uniref:Alpha-ketoglutarate-dependent dioxygenase alkB 6 n=1 Tax=Morella rubra TaxID=262757 RepID=A0A6A1WHH4_9ROSI|nr:hypothetical protein CJ030_MR2G016181 [Morella rubra]
MEAKERLNDFKVGSRPTVMYIPDFISETEETMLLSNSHQDGPAYFPVVAILSLGSPVIMNFTPHSRFRLCTDHDKDNDTSGGTSRVGKDKWLHGHQPFSILLMPRSLLIFKDEVYSDYLHGIEANEEQLHDGAVNEIEALKHSAEDLARLGSEGGVEEIRKDLKTIHRTTTRISLTCRSVLKVHKKLFKF